MAFESTNLFYEEKSKYVSCVWGGCILIFFFIIYTIGLANYIANTSGSGLIKIFHYNVSLNGLRKMQSSTTKVSGCAVIRI